MTAVECSLTAPTGVVTIDWPEQTKVLFEALKMHLMVKAFAYINLPKINISITTVRTIHLIQMYFF